MEEGLAFIEAIRKKGPADKETILRMQTWGRNNTTRNI